MPSVMPVADSAVAEAPVPPGVVSSHLPQGGAEQLHGPGPLAGAGPGAPADGATRNGQAGEGTDPDGAVQVASADGRNVDAGRAAGETSADRDEDRPRGRAGSESLEQVFRDAAGADVHVESGEGATSAPRTWLNASSGASVGGQIPPPEADELEVGENPQNESLGRSARTLRGLRQDVRSVSARVLRPPPVPQARSGGLKECTKGWLRWVVHCVGLVFVLAILAAPLVLATLSAVERGAVSAAENELALATWSPSSPIGSDGGFADAALPVKGGFGYMRVCVIVLGGMILCFVPFALAMGEAAFDTECGSSVAAASCVLFLTAYASSMVLVFNARNSSGANWLLAIRSSSDEHNSKCLPALEVPAGAVVRQGCAENPIDYAVEVAWTREDDVVGARCKGEAIAMIPEGMSDQYAAGCVCASSFEWPTFDDMNANHEHEWAQAWGSDPAAEYCASGSTTREAEWCAQYQVRSDTEGDSYVTDKCEDTQRSVLTFCYVSHALRSAKPCGELDELQQNLNTESSLFLAFGIVVVVMSGMLLLLGCIRIMVSRSKQ